MGISWWEPGDLLPGQEIADKEGQNEPFDHGLETPVWTHGRLI